MAVMNGCDAIIFTAGIGENSALIRKKSVEEMGNLGVVIDEEKNEKAAPGQIEKISADSSVVDIYVIPTNEELVIAIDAAKIATASNQSPWV
jgi:acetate kinase